MRYSQDPCDRPWWMRRKAAAAMPLEPRMILTAVHVQGRTCDGTGFLITVKSCAVKDKAWGYVVTAHHVIHGEDPIYVRAANAFGDGELYEAELVDDWRQPIPGLDLAIAPFPERPDRKYSAISMEDHLVPNMVVRGPLLGASIYYIGLFAPAGRMMAREGIIGALDVDGLPHDNSHDPDPPYDYIAHLIDCRSYGGFSGSPCFMQIMYARRDPLDVPLPIKTQPGVPVRDLASMAYLAVPCGMFTEHYDDENEPTHKGDVAISKYGVGVMLRGDEIQRALMTPKMQDERQEWDTEYLEAEDAKPKVVPKSVRTPHDISRGDFDDALHRATRITPPAESAPED
jgi:hypothetical protein